MSFVALHAVGHAAFWKSVFGSRRSQFEECPTTVHEQTAGDAVELGSMPAAKAECGSKTDARMMTSATPARARVNTPRFCRALTPKTDKCEYWYG
jgi:hypothetical protein